MKVQEIIAGKWKSVITVPLSKLAEAHQEYQDWLEELAETQEENAGPPEKMKIHGRNG